MHEATVDTPAPAAPVGLTTGRPVDTGDLVIVSNRLPVRRVVRGGVARWDSSPGGLVTALRPMLSRREGRWIGWPGFAGDVPAPFRHDHVDNYPLAISREEQRGFYEGFCNRTLWPLYHDAIRSPEFRPSWWSHYVEVNRRFAAAAADASSPGGTIWIHDYQLQMAPAMARELQPRARIGFFLHIPFPPAALFAQLPWRKAILEGLLGADVIGFQTADDARNFREAAVQMTGARESGCTLRFDERRILACEFPISIDVSMYERLAEAPRVHRRVADLQRRLGEDRKILLGIDRLDYTKGIEHRLRAFREALQSQRLSAASAVFVQVAVPSRERVLEYRELKAHVERLVGEINGEFGSVGRVAVHYLHRGVPPEELVALYRAAHAMIVTPLRDGMNLVAKEYVAARTDERGVLILSEFAGAAHELTDAILVNPHNIDGMSAAMEQALRLTETEQALRMRRMRRIVRRNDVHHWARAFLDALAGLSTPAGRSGHVSRADLGDVEGEPPETIVTSRKAERPSRPLVA